jgi:hypothetical protein
MKTKTKDYFFPVIIIKPKTVHSCKAKHGIKENNESEWRRGKNRLKKIIQSMESGEEEIK